ncbi:MAG: hypothetical protein Kow00111_07420 [Thermincola ferriacetica]
MRFYKRMFCFLQGHTNTEGRWQNIMGVLAELAMGLGLAGAAGIRARYPLLFLGLLTRYTDKVFLREPISFLGSWFSILLAVTALILDFYAAMFSEGAVGYEGIKVVIRVLAGATVFAGLVSLFSLFTGFLFGGAVALVSYLAVMKVTPTVLKVGNTQKTETFIDLLALAATVLLIIFPFIAYVVWALLILLLFRSRINVPADQRRVRNLRLWKN